MRCKNTLIRIIGFFELLLASFQGKGGGSETVEKEFSQAMTLFSKKKPKLCIDIGGNIGAYSEQILSKYPDCSIVIFEPSKSNVEILKEKFQSNSKIFIEQVAISNVKSEATLFSDKDGSGLASLTKRRLKHFNINFSNTETVNTIKFADYWKEKLQSQNIDICKIDIEGHEMDALSGFGDSIQHIEIIQFEIGGCNIDTKTFFQDFWYFFEERNFDLFRASPLGLIKLLRYKESDEFFAPTNYLAKKKV